MGTDWTLSLNYLSARGLSEGTEFVYDRGDFLGIPGQAAGKLNFWGISDRGTDNLGWDRPSVMPEPDVNYRYKVFDQHRQELGEGFTFTAELGKISDRNFLQEYFTQDWDELKDPTTDLELKFRRENFSMSLFGQARLDDFVTETQWLPRFDHFLLGQSLLDDKLTLFEHTSLGYAQFKVARCPVRVSRGRPSREPSALGTAGFLRRAIVSPQRNRPARRTGAGEDRALPAGRAGLLGRRPQGQH